MLPIAILFLIAFLIGIYATYFYIYEVLPKSRALKAIHRTPTTPFLGSLLVFRKTVPKGVDFGQGLYIVFFKFFF